MQRYHPQHIAHLLLGFNPHPSRRTGATTIWSEALQKHVVSILTRPEGRVQPIRDVANEALSSFQSSPVPKDGCNQRPCREQPRLAGFNPHPSRRTGATSGGRGALTSGHVFQSSPVPKDGCNDRISARRHGRCRRFNPHPSRRTGATIIRMVGNLQQHVSILTRPEGRVQLVSRTSLRKAMSFQSSPVPKDGCNATVGRGGG